MTFTPVSVSICFLKLTCKLYYTIAVFSLYTEISIMAEVYLSSSKRTNFQPKRKPQSVGIN